MPAPESTTEAAERYREFVNWREAERASGFEGVLWPYEGATEDALVLASAYIALTDPTPIDSDFLRSVGFVRHMQPAADSSLSLGHPADAKFVMAERRHREKEYSWRVGGEPLPLALQPKTRGAVRMLLAALNVPLTEPAAGRSEA